MMVEMKLPMRSTAARSTTNQRSSLPSLSSLPFKYRQARRGIHIACAAAVRHIEIDGVQVSAPCSRPSKAIVHLLGGAFAGASPVIFYEKLVEKLAERYTVISNPYPISFQHDVTARNCHASLLTTLQALRSNSATTYLAPESLPIHGIGHSNGALLHLLIGALCSPVVASSNIIISFNNKDVGDAVPVPVVEPLQATLRPLRTDGGSLAEAANAAAQNAVGTLLTGLGISGALATEPSIEPTLKQLVPFGAQLGSVLDEIGDGGAMSFTPEPAESRRIISAGYSVPQTLLVQFEDDSIDESDEILEILLRNRNINREVSKLRLPGNHLTPVGRNVRWNVNGSFSPFDAVAQAAVQLTQQDLDRFATEVIKYIEGQ